MKKHYVGTHAIDSEQWILLHLVITVASTVDDVLSFMKQRDLDEWIPLFEKRKINGKKLWLLTSKDLQDLGVELEFDRKCIMAEIEEMKAGTWFCDYNLRVPYNISSYPQ